MRWRFVGGNAFIFPDRFRIIFFIFISLALPFLLALSFLLLLSLSLSLVDKISMLRLYNIQCLFSRLRQQSFHIGYLRNSSNRISSNNFCTRTYYVTTHSLLEYIIDNIETIQKRISHSSSIQSDRVVQDHLFLFSLFIALS